MYKNITDRKTRIALIKNPCYEGKANMLYGSKMKAKGQHHCAAINLVLGSPIPAHTLGVKVMVGSPGKEA